MRNEGGLVLLVIGSEGSGTVGVNHSLITPKVMLSSILLSSTCPPNKNSGAEYTQA